LVNIVWSPYWGDGAESPPVAVWFKSDTTLTPGLRAFLPPSREEAATPFEPRHSVLIPWERYGACDPEPGRARRPNTERGARTLVFFKAQDVGPGHPARAGRRGARTLVFFKAQG
jgi:hypothetical protein